MIKSGLSIVETKEIETLKPLEKFFTKSEIEESKRKIQSLAGKLAGKKSFLIAAGINDGDILNKIEIKKRSSGKPYIKINDFSIKKNLEEKYISISISHIEKFAVAFCLIYDKKETGIP
ncbi:MAG: hypothetical protein DRP67_04600 [Candidatus Omnitrophota bacterium]|nr:MAG: hypothetical protein DRP67_04600 [Candidatus Omnitrophota bacterium]